MKSLLIKYKKQVMYLIFGVLTTLVNVVSYFILTRICQFGTIPSIIIAWLLAVAFAYITNRKWVFESTATGFLKISKELAAFFGSRLFSGGLDLGIMFLFVTLLGFDDMIIKILSNILVIVINYLLSNLIIFKKDAVCDA